MHYFEFGKRDATIYSGGTTSSSSTGPTDGHDSSQGIDGDGREGSGSDYCYTEVSSQFNKHFLLRTPELDFSNALVIALHSLSTLSLVTLNFSFWFLTIYSKLPPPDEEQITILNI